MIEVNRNLCRNFTTIPTPLQTPPEYQIEPQALLLPHAAYIIPYISHAHTHTQFKYEVYV